MTTCHDLIKRVTGVECVSTCSISTHVLTPPPTVPTLNLSAYRLTPTSPLFFLFSVPSACAKNNNILRFVLLYDHARSYGADHIERTSNIIRSFCYGGTSKIAERGKDLVHSAQAGTLQGAQTSKSLIDDGGAVSTQRRTIQLAELYRRARQVRGLCRADQAGDQS